MKKYYLFILLAYFLGIATWAITNKKVATPVKEEFKTVPSSIDFPNLLLDVKFFNENDVWWGSVHGAEQREGIDNFKMVALDNKTVYQSYPTTDCTIKAYSNEKRELETKSLEKALSKVDILEGMQEIWAESAKEAYSDWGKIVTHYLPDDLVESVEKFDIDGDSKPETIVTYNYYGRANAGSTRTDIVKNETIIFSLGEDQSYIKPADTNNGFFVEWRISDDTPRCCPEGYRRTRFVFQDGKFIPIYEQEIRYMKVGEKK